MKKNYLHYPDLSNIRIKLTLLFILTALLLTSCTSLLKSLSDSLYQQRDVKLVEEGAPAYLLLVEALINSNPKDRSFLSLGIQLFSAYSTAFINDKERSKIFIEKTKDWAFDLLRTYPNFKKFENAGYDDYKKWIKDINKKDVPYVFWAADAWIMWIIANSDNMDVMITLPKAKVIIDKIYQLDSNYYYGSPHLFYGIFNCIMPKIAGGDLDKAKEEFDKALIASQDKFLATKVSYAIFYYKAKYDKDGFKKTLEDVINSDINKYPEMRLLNLIAVKSAKEALSHIDEYFYSDDF